MYERIIDLDKERAGELEERLKDIASFVASMIELTEIKVFDEIKFAFVWGRTKKKYKINISPAEVSFAKLVYNLSLEKKNILLDISKGNYSSERDY